LKKSTIIADYIELFVLLAYLHNLPPDLKNIQRNIEVWVFFLFYLRFPPSGLGFISVSSKSSKNSTLSFLEAGATFGPGKICKINRLITIY